VDCHCHVRDPDGFAYASDVAYHPIGKETGSADYFTQVLDAYGVQHALVVCLILARAPTIRCLLSATARGQGRYKGMAWTTTAPALTKLGVPDFAAPMFIFYCAMLSEVSPPTALSPFAAAITGRDPHKTTLLERWMLIIAGFAMVYPGWASDVLGALAQGPRITLLNCTDIP
jgi:hypothetical protein